MPRRYQASSARRGSVKNFHSSGPPDGPITTPRVAIRTSSCGSFPRRSSIPAAGGLNAAARACRRARADGACHPFSQPAAPRRPGSRSSRKASRRISRQIFRAVSSTQRLPYPRKPRARASVERRCFETSNTASAGCGAAPASRRSRCSPWPWGSGPTRRSSACSTRWSCGRSPTPIPAAWCGSGSARRRRGWSRARRPSPACGRCATPACSPASPPITTRTST